MKIKTIIVDDESEAREGIKALIADDEDIELVSLCENGLEAIQLLKNTTIDLMFLDIQMPVISGLDVIRSISKESLPWIIFVTAHDEYSLNAFELHALDYILKPFSDERFFHSLSRAKELIRMKKDRDHFLRISNDEKVKESSVVNSPIDDKLVIKENGKVFFLPFHQIAWIEAYDYYIKIHCNDTVHVIRSTMKQMDGQLPEDHFLRIHKSTIINKSFIQSVESNSGELWVALSTGDKRVVSRTYKPLVKNLM